MSDCPQSWSGGPGCEGCWATIHYQLANYPADKILPRPEFCQDAAFIAWCLDGRLQDISELKILLGEARGGEPARITSPEVPEIDPRVRQAFHEAMEETESQRIAEIFDEARQEAGDDQTRR